MNAPFSDIGGHGRQAATDLKQVSPDHFARYAWAAQIISRIRVPVDGLYSARPGLIVDAGCGVGYGSYIIAKGLEATACTGIVCGFDVEPSAIEHAERHFAHNQVEYAVADAATFFDESPLVPDIAVAFEVLEHLREPTALLKGLAKSGAHYLLASVPNEEEYPFIAPPDSKDRPPGHRPTGHVRHYTTPQFETLLHEGGWRCMGRFYQQSKQDPVVRPGWIGRTILALAVPLPGGLDDG